jgi:UDP:flavonoid glycosyltransferase YjiC (YdhE family)
MRNHTVDVVVVDLCALGGRVLHERTGIPWATLGISPLSIPAPEIPPFGSGRQPPPHLWGRLANAAHWRVGSLFLTGLTDAYERQRALLGLGRLPRGVTTFDHMISDQLHLQASTPSLEFPRRHWPSQVSLVGPLLAPTPAGFAVPAWWDDVLAAERVVHITQGSVATDPADLTLPSLQALKNLDALIVVTTPDPDALAGVPSHVRVADHIPHPVLLPHTDIMISNAGYNGVKAALGHGVPLVLAPWGNDQPDVAARVTRLGAGIDLHVRRPRPEAIRAAVEQVGAETRYRQAAGHVREEFTRYPGGVLAADALTALTATRPAVTRS